jgi:hypothetical protein
MAYVYIHRRKTDGKVFYVGKGTGNRFRYKKNRNKYWHNVVNKHGYRWEIVRSNLTEEEAYKIEEETIRKYTRDKAPLVNLTSGGNNGYVKGNRVEFAALYPDYYTKEELRGKLMSIDFFVNLGNRGEM